MHTGALELNTDRQIW